MTGKTDLRITPGENRTWTTGVQGAQTTTAPRLHIHLHGLQYMNK